MYYDCKSFLELSYTVRGQAVAALPMYILFLEYSTSQFRANTRKVCCRRKSQFQANSREVRCHRESSFRAPPLRTRLALIGVLTYGVEEWLPFRSDLSWQRTVQTDLRHRSSKVSSLWCRRSPAASPTPSTPPPLWRQAGHVMEVASCACSRLTCRMRGLSSFIREGRYRRWCIATMSRSIRFCV
jgi:hypothetical protein